MPESKRGISHFGLNPEAAATIEVKLKDISNGASENPVLVAATKSYNYLESLKKQVDETEARARDAQIIAQTDSLTGLLNRRFLDNYIDNFDHRSKKPAVAFCDADNLGAVNKEVGDKKGDELIIAISKNLKNSVRDGDLVIRKGGDEFVIIIEDYSNFEELKDKLSQRFKSKQVLGPKFSFGIVQYDESQDSSLFDTIQRADDKMKEDYPDKKIVKS